MSKHGPLYEKSNALERLYHINHIPYRYWKATIDDVFFSNTSYTPTDESKIRVPETAQHKYYKDLNNCITDTRSVRDFSGSFVCISSTPSEESSMTAGCALATSLIRADQSANIAIVDLSHFYQVHKDQSYDFVLIHNVTSDSTRDRIQLARDYVKWATRTSLCILCTSGKNPIEMCYEVFRMPANMVLYTDERNTKRTFDY